MPAWTNIQAVEEVRKVYGSLEHSAAFVLEIIEDCESALVAVHMQEALYSKDATDLFLRSYVNVLREVVKSRGDEVAVDELVGQG